MAHSLFGGGKRLRPALLLWTYDALRRNSRRQVRMGRSSALTAACALEVIHTYSLIHDDLPAMDDDVLRRGRPTCHVAFDEATAILAGDGLQAWGFALLGRLAHAAPDLVDLVATAVGPVGMVGGQLEDLAAEGQAVTPRIVRRIHERKTARLIAAALGAGAYLAGAGNRTVEGIVLAGRTIGLAFQGADDLLDMTSTAEQLGKSAGKDAAAGKATWVRLDGLAKAGQRTEKLGRRGWLQLQKQLPAGPPSELLLDLVVLMWRRDK
jgi:geranylgeranyl pyrophosphate synthase